MNDFTILHLSDLHLNVKSNVLPTLMEKLLDDISIQLEYVDNKVIIVVTGDIIHKGNYDYEPSVIQFFSRLKEIVGKKFAAIFIVPGNHDKERNAVDEMMLKKYKFSIEEETSVKFKRKYWKYINFAFDKHIKLVNKIYDIFNENEQESDKENNEIKSLEETYGLSLVTIDKIRIAFIRFNTAWACVGDKDERKLKMGLFQLKEILEEYEEKKSCENKKTGNRYDITIALAHHPVNWLTGKEETRVQYYLLKNSLLNCDIYISGHIHDRDVINFHNTTHSLNTLVSGIGWPDSENTSNTGYEHTYSWYTFNLDANSIDVYVRKSDRAGTFEADTSIYTSPLFKEEEKIAMPINENKTQAFLEIDTVKGRTSKVVYITPELIPWMKSYMNIVIKVKSKLNIELEKSRRNAFEEFSTQKGLRDEEQKIIRKFLIDMEEGARNTSMEIQKRYSEINNKYFDGFLAGICRTILNVIECELYEKDQQKHDLRVHFRRASVENAFVIYKMLSIACSEGRDGSSMSPIKGQLIEAAYENRTPLIASINSKICEESFNDNRNKSDEKRKWYDFITIIPGFEENNYCYKDEKNDLRYAPWLTFGITIYSEKDKNLLYLLDYYRFNDLMADCINEFLWFFPTDKQGFEEYLKDVKTKKWGKING